MNIGIIGMGLIGGSLARAILKNTQHIVFAADKDAEVMARARLMDAFHTTLCPDNANQIDVLFVALTPASAENVMRRYCPLLKAGAIVLDCGGVKRQTVNLMEQLKNQYPALEFLGFHPMAGKEYSGISHSSPSLFERASAVIIPVHNSIDALERIKTLLKQIGFETFARTDAQSHDRIIAYTSQLAHIVSGAFVKSPTARLNYGFSAGSFRDLTRVARMNAAMWSELMYDNRDFLCDELQILQNNLDKYRQALQAGDKDALYELLEEGNLKKIAIDSVKTAKLKELK